jgi:hypothetical protein
MTRKFLFHRYYHVHNNTSLLQYKIMLYYRFIVLTIYRHENISSFSFNHEKDNNGKFEYMRLIQCHIPFGKKMISITCNIYSE